MNGHVKMIELFVKTYDQDVNMSVIKRNRDGSKGEDFGFTPIFAAVTSGSIQGMNTLVRLGADAHHQDRKRRTILKYACEFEQFEVVKRLIEGFKLDPNERDFEGCTALFHAVFSPEIVDYFVNVCGVDVMRTNDAGLHLMDIMELMMVKGDVTSAEDVIVFNQSLNILRQAMPELARQRNDRGQNGMMEALERKDLEQAEEYFNTRSIYLGDVDIQGRNVVHHAVMNGFLVVARAIVYFRVDLVNHVDEYGRTPVMYAIDKGETSFACDVISRDYVNVNVKDHEGRTALHYAVERGDEAIVSKLLAQMDCRVNVETLAGQTPLHVAIDHGNVNMVDLLLGNPGESLYVEDGRGYTPLMAAAFENRYEVVEMILGKKYTLGKMVERAARLTTDERIKELLLNV